MVKELHHVCHWLVYTPAAAARETAWSDQRVPKAPAAGEVVPRKELEARKRSWPSRTRRRVLILAHGDGWIEVYAQKHVDVRIEMVPHMTTSAGEIQAEEYVELSLPKRYREVYWPGNRRAADVMRVFGPSDIVQREYDLELLRAIQQLDNEQEEGRKVWTL